MPFEGELIVQCDFVGFPPPSVIWLKNSVEFIPDNLRAFINITFHAEGGVSNLTIMNLEIEDGGDYSCRVNSSRGVGNASITVIVVCELIRSTMKYSLSQKEALFQPSS